MTACCPACAARSERINSRPRSMWAVADARATGHPLPDPRALLALASPVRAHPGVLGCELMVTNAACLAALPRPALTTIQVRTLLDGFHVIRANAVAHPTQM